MATVFKAIYYICFAWLAFISFICLIMLVTSGITAAGAIATGLVETWWTITALVFVLVRFVGSLFIRQSKAQN